MKVSGGTIRYVLPILLIFVIGLLLRTYLIERTEVSVQSSYSTHAKTALKFSWTRDSLATWDCRWITKEEIFNQYFVLDPVQVRFGALYHELKRSNHPPLYYIIMHILHASIPDGLPPFTQAYYLNLLFWSVSFYLLFLIARKLFDSNAGLFLILLYFSFTLPLAHLSVYHKGYELQMMLTLWAFWHILKAEKMEQFSWTHAAVLSFIYFLVLSVHYLAYVVLLGLIVWFMARKWILQEQPNIKAQIIALGFGSILSIAFFPYAIDDLFQHQAKVDKGGTPQGSDLMESIGMIVTDGIGAFIFSVCLGLILIALVRNIKKGWNKSWVSKMFLAGIFFVASVTLLGVGQGRFRYIYCLLPFIALFLFFPLKKVRWQYGLLGLAVAFQMICNMWLLYQESTNQRSAHSVISRWHTKPLYDDLPNTNKLLIASSNIDAERYRKHFFHSPHRYIGIVDKEVCSMLTDLQNTTVIFDHKDLPEIHQDLLTELNRAGLKEKGDYGSYKIYTR